MNLTSPDSLPAPITAILQAQQMKGEQWVNHIRLGFSLLGLLGLLFAYKVNTLEANLVYLVQGCGWLLYSGILQIYLRRRGDRYLPWLTFLTVTLDLCLLSLVAIASAVNHTGVLEYYYNYMAYSSFMFWNLLSGLRFTLAAGIYSAVLTALLNGLILFFSVTQNLVQVTSISVYGTAAINVTDQAVVILFISAPGVIAGLIARIARNLVLRSAQDSMERARLEKEKAQLGKYLSRELVDWVLEDPDRMELGGRRQVATLLFSDIRNFTPLSERREPEEVVRFLNAYFTRMVGLVFENRGTLDKYMGDGLMAEFGVPFPVDRGPVRAVLTAIEMHLALQELNRDSMSTEEPIAIGVGIATGPVVAGNIGTKDRMEYTCIGDTVNLAARLEKLNREAGSRIIICETTHQGLPDFVPTRPLPPTHIKGKQEDVSVYAVEIPDNARDLVARMRALLDENPGS